MDFNETTTQKAKKLYEFIYDYAFESLTKFDTKYPEYSQWKIERDKKYSYIPVQNRPDVMNYIVEKYLQ